MNTINMFQSQPSMFQRVQLRVFSWSLSLPHSLATISSWYGMNDMYGMYGHLFIICLHITNYRHQRVWVYSRHRIVRAVCRHRIVRAVCRHQIVWAVCRHQIVWAVCRHQIVWAVCRHQRVWVYSRHRIVRAVCRHQIEYGQYIGIRYCGLYDNLIAVLISAERLL